MKNYFTIQLIFDTMHDLTTLFDTIHGPTVLFQLPFSFSFSFSFIDGTFNNKFSISAKYIVSKPTLNAKWSVNLHTDKHWLM